MTNDIDTFGNKIYRDFVAQSHSLSQGGRSTPVDYDEMAVQPLTNSVSLESAKWLTLEMSGFAGEFRTHYTTTFDMPLDVLERILQIFLEGEHGAADQDTIGQMVWRLAKHRSQLIQSAAEASA